MQEFKYDHGRFEMSLAMELIAKFRLAPLIIMALCRIFDGPKAILVISFFAMVVIMFIHYYNYLAKFKKLGSVTFTGTDILIEADSHNSVTIKASEVKNIKVIKLSHFDTVDETENLFAVMIDTAIGEYNLLIQAGETGDATILEKWIAG